MPGIALRVGAESASSSGAASSFERLLARSATAEETGHRVLACLGSSFVGFVGYDGYPVMAYADGDRRVVIEGRIYNKPPDEIEKSLRTLTLHLAEDPLDAERLIRDFEDDFFGDYIVCVLTRGGYQGWVFSDLLGRLPIYYHVGTDVLIVSRECKAILEETRPDFDPVGVAEFLWMGYPLGSRTLYQGVKFAPHALFLSYEVLDSRVSVKVASLRPLVPVPEPVKADMRVEHLAGELVDVFLTSLHDITRWNGQVLVGLSGGKDSRSVAGGLARLGTPFIPFTRSDVHSAREVPYARAVAEKIGSLNHRVIQVQKYDWTSFEQLVSFMDGSLDVSLSYMLPFLREVRRLAEGAATYLTGDSGDFVFGFSAGKPAVLYRDCIGRIGRSSANTYLEKLVGLSPGALKSHIREFLDQGASDSGDGSETGALLRGKMRRWIFEGEDRNRHFFWETAPLVYYPFYRQIMVIPDSLKRDLVLYREFLRILSPALAALPESNTGHPLTSSLFRAKNRVHWLLHDAMPPWLREPLRDLLTQTREFTPPEAVAEKARQLLGNDQRRAQRLFRAAGEAILHPPSPAVYYRALTLLIAAKGASMRQTRT